jgi:hypothetical protein
MKATAQGGRAGTTIRQRHTDRSARLPERFARHLGAKPPPGREPPPCGRCQVCEIGRSWRCMKPNADIETAHQSAILVHLGNISYRIGCKRLYFDALLERFIDHEEANRFSKPACRKNYRIPDPVVTRCGCKIFQVRNTWPAPLSRTSR